MTWTWEGLHLRIAGANLEEENATTIADKIALMTNTLPSPPDVSVAAIFDSYELTLREVFLSAVSRVHQQRKVQINKPEISKKYIGR